MHKPSTGRFGGMIEFVDAGHTRWRVTERDCRQDPGSHADWCLVFASDDVVRRVWAYPVDWHLLPALALSALSRRL